MSTAEHTASYTVVCSAQQSLCASVLSVPPLPKHRISKRRGELRRRTCGLGIGYDSTFCRPSSLLPERLHPGIRTGFVFSKVIRCNALLQSIADMIKFVDVNFHQIGSRESLHYLAVYHWEHGLHLEVALSSFCTSCISGYECGRFCRGRSRLHRRLRL